MNAAPLRAEAVLGAPMSGNSGGGLAKSHGFRVDLLEGDEEVVQIGSMGLHLGSGIVVVAESGIFQLLQALLHQFLDSIRIVHAAKEDGVEVVSTRLLLFSTTATASGFDFQVGDAKHALNGALRDGNVLDVGKGDGGFAYEDEAFADAQAAVGDEIPALLEIEADHGERDESGNYEEDKDQCGDGEGDGECHGCASGFVEEQAENGCQKEQAEADHCADGFQEPQREQVFVEIGCGAENLGFGFIAGRRFGFGRNAQDFCAEFAEGVIHGRFCEKQFLNLYVYARPHPGPMASQAHHKMVAPNKLFASRNVVPRGEGESSADAGEADGVRLRGVAELS